MRRPAAAAAMTAPPTTLMRIATANQDRHRLRNCAKKTTPTACNQTLLIVPCDLIVACQVQVAQRAGPRGSWCYHHGRGYNQCIDTC